MSTKNVENWGLSKSVTERVYSNSGNSALLDLLDKEFDSVLDIGCGAGDNAALVKSMNHECDIFGITYSASEAALAQKHMTKCWTIDVEVNLPDDLSNQTFDSLIFSHVLEHLRDPAKVVVRFSRLLRRGGRL
jgi:2-polyprenyl-3-methyl-5-hydroxy-6-metoxy-1,4-benzoquinol methylase